MPPADHPATMSTKRCPTCKATKLVLEFDKNRYRSDGLSTECRLCRGLREHLRYLANADAMKAYQKDYRQANTEACAARDRAKYLRIKSDPEAWQHLLSIRRTSRIKREGAPGGHTETEWQTVCEAWDRRCARCGERRPLTLDHILPISRGGTDDITNIQPLCSRCNDIKGTQAIQYPTKWIPRR